MDDIHPKSPIVEPEISEIAPNKKAYDAYCKQVDREDKLINNRLSWMLTTEGLLFSALALMASSNANMQVDKGIVAALKQCIPIIGIVIPASALIAIISAHRVVNKLQEHWTKLEHYFPYHPSPFGSHHFAFPILGPSVVLPLSIIAAWCWIIYQIKPFLFQ